MCKSSVRIYGELMMISRKGTRRKSIIRIMDYIGNDECASS